MSTGEASDDPSRSRCTHRTGLRADHRRNGTVSVWQADRGLSRPGAVGKIQRESAAPRAHHQTGSSIVRFLLVETAQVTVRSLPEWRSQYVHLMMRRGRKIAKVAMARKLAVRLYWMWRKGWDYEQWQKFGSYVGQPGHRRQNCIYRQTNLEKVILLYRMI